MQLSLFGFQVRNGEIDHGDCVRIINANQQLAIVCNFGVNRLAFLAHRDSPATCVAPPRNITGA